MKKIFESVIITLSLFTLIISIYIILGGHYINFLGLFSEIKAKELSSILQGTTGILLSTISILLIIYTIILSNKSSYESEIQRNVITMITYHRKNYESIIKEDNEIFVDCFSRIFDYKEALENTFSSRIQKNNIKEEEILDLAYLLYIFGYNSIYHDKIYLYYSKRQIKNFTQEEIKGLFSGSWLYTTGQASLLSRYFRQMYYIITYIDSQNISLSKKQELVKLLRVQLNNEEQTLLFFNSISQLGFNWKKERKDKCSDNYNFIERYNLLKNISSIDIGKINLKSYYPKLKLEYE